MAVWQRESAEAHAPFRRAEGDIEFSTDGTSVNTMGGWREMRVGIFSNRHRGEPAHGRRCSSSFELRKRPSAAVAGRNTAGLYNDSRVTAGQIEPGVVEPWQVGLGVVFISGVLFLLVSLCGVRKKLLEAISPSMRNGIAVGIGLLELHPLHPKIAQVAAGSFRENKPPGIISLEAALGGLTGDAK